MKYGTPNYMDLNIEIIGDDRLAMAHNYVLNGDVMADPDIEFTVDKKNRMLYPQTYQQDSLQYFERVDGDSTRARELNHLCMNGSQMLLIKSIKCKLFILKTKNFLSKKIKML